jgi:hypothetical protein
MYQKLSIGIVLFIIGLFVIHGSLMAADLNDNGDGTVTDFKTGLIWQKAEGGRVLWEMALVYCDELDLAGKSDWRLPNYKELQSLVNYKRYGPTLDKIKFPDIVSEYYWSSTTFAGQKNKAWFANFHRGGVENNNKSNSYNVRCVRSGL